MKRFTQEQIILNQLKTKGKVEIVCRTCSKTFLVYPSQRKCKTTHCSMSCYNVTRIEILKKRRLPKSFYEHLVRVRRANGSYVYSEEVKKKMSEAHVALDVRGERNPNWKGGRGQEHQRLRKTKKYFDWRTAVFTRDGFRCVICKVQGSRKNPIEADHIKPFAYFPEYRFDISNGQTLCIPCHKETTTWGSKAQKLYA
jgi:hypothetical protein